MRAFVTARPREEGERSRGERKEADPANWYDGFLRKLTGGSNPEFECIVGTPPCGKTFYGATRGAVHLKCRDGSGIACCENITAEQTAEVKARYERLGARESKKPKEDDGGGGGGGLGKSWLPKQWKEQADKIFARFIFLCLLPFSFGTNKWFRAFISDGLRVLYIPPGKDLLRGRLLDEEDAAVQAKVDRVLAESDYLQVASDGWSNLRGESIISYVITCTQGDFFLHATDASLAEKKSAVFCFADLEKFFEKFGVSKVTGFISDTEAKMRALWLLIEAKYNHIHAYGCCTHILQLVIKAICALSWAAPLLKRSNSIILWFRNHHFPAAILKQYSERLLGKALRPIKNSATRFAAWAYAVERLLKLKSSFRAIVDDEKYKTAVRGKKGRADEPDDKEPTTIINDNSFWDGLVQLLKVLMPVRIFLRYTDRRDSNICYIYEKWSKLQQHMRELPIAAGMTEQIRTEIVEIVGQKWNDLHEDVHAAAYCFDPTNRTCNIEGENDEVWQGFLKILKRHLSSEECTAALIEWARYQSPGGLKPEVIAVIGKVSPRQFWFSFCGSFPNLRKVALMITPLRAGTRCVESHFSVMGNAHSKARNRLVNGVVRKITRVNQNTKMLELAGKVALEGDYEKQRAEIEKRVEEEEAAKIAAFDESDSDYASDTDQEA